MAILVVPPTQVIPFDSERLVRHQQTMDEFRSSLAKQWNATAGDEVKFGAHRRTRDYKWNESFDGILRTYFVFAGSGKTADTEVARIAVLFRKDNCQMLGSSVVWGAEWKNSLPVDLKATESTNFAAASSRKFDVRKSPLRLSLETFGYWGPSLAWLSEAFVGEKLSAEGYIVHSDLSGLTCFRQSAGAQSDAGASGTVGEKVVGADSTAQKSTVQGAPLLKRGHRQLRMRLTGKKPDQTQKWPLMSGQLKIFSLPFNAPRKSAELTSGKPEPFNPEKIAALAVEEIRNHTQNLDDKAIKVTRREGRFVTVDRGAAFGLKIGMHLTGPNGSALHVIRFDPAAGSDDAAILLIRKDSSGQPLGEGAVLQIDGTQYPAR
jgi:hypothetical protein